MSLSAYLLRCGQQAGKGQHILAPIPEELITKALQRTLLAQRPALDLLVHSDRGRQYCGNTYQTRLHRHLALHSPRRCGECYDNAQAERLWSRLNTEELVAHE